MILNARVYRDPYYVAANARVTRVRNAMSARERARIRQQHARIEERRQLVAMDNRIRRQEYLRMLAWQLEEHERRFPESLAVPGFNLPRFVSFEVGWK